LFLTVFWSCTSCNGSSQNHDLQDYENTDISDDLSDDPSDEALAESEDTESEEADNVEFADVDYQGAEDCPALKAAKFSYYNDDLSRTENNIR